MDSADYGNEPKRIPEAQRCHFDESKINTALQILSTDHNNVQRQREHFRNVGARRAV